MVLVPPGGFVFLGAGPHVEALIDAAHWRRDAAANITPRWRSIFARGVAAGGQQELQRAVY